MSKDLKKTGFLRRKGPRRSGGLRMRKKLTYFLPLSRPGAMSFIWTLASLYELNSG